MKLQMKFDAMEPQVVRLCDLKPGQSADCFVLLASKEKSKTRDGKPYYRVSLRDAQRAATSMIWSDSTFFPDCDTTWQPGQFYKVRGRYLETDFGPQFDLEKIRPVEAADEAQGFRTADLVPCTRFNIEGMFAELLTIAKERIADEPLRRLVTELLQDHQPDICRMAAATRNHHAFTGGYLEHVLSVTRLAMQLADKYADYYPDMQPPLNTSLVAAGAILHDIGKVRELNYQPTGSTYTAAGRLVGHIFIGRDMIRDKARSIPEFDPETLLRLEHIIISHQSLPEWGSPIPPSTPEAFLVAEADNIDAKFHEMAAALMVPPSPGEEFTSRDNPLRRAIFRGLVVPDSTTSSESRNVKPR
jgi:3'-5' exoribonuclease